MADISKITLPNGLSYNFKDETARTGLDNKLPLSGGTLTGSLYANGATDSATQQVRNLASGTAAATTSNCPSGCWYGQYS